MPNRLTGFWAEARRRRIFSTVGMYVVAMWGLSQGAAELGPVFGAPDGFVRGLVAVAVLLLPVVIVLAWMFDLGLRGIVRDPGPGASHAPREFSETDAFNSGLAHQATISALDLSRGIGAVLVHWTDGAGQSNSVTLGASFFLGRGQECRVRFYDPLVSRKHARVYFEDGRWYIEDLDSRNCTLVDGQKIERIVLEGLSLVQVSESSPTIQLEILSPGPATRAAIDRVLASTPIAHIRPK
ncbi:MAG TPA: FHA domain-containing protein [Myxococcales bacterium]|nr:FHA domain-containing protein [Myxococcales bacterium]HIK86251.1 FHA domain-containing protein [Myxococcales bacterium]